MSFSNQTTKGQFIIWLMRSRGLIKDESRKLEEMLGQHRWKSWGP